MKKTILFLIYVTYSTIFSQLKLIDELPQKNGDVYFTFIENLDGTQKKNL